MRSKTKQCQNCTTKFTIEPEDFEFYKKIDVPEPTFCPDCRAQRRMAFGNQRTIYKRKSNNSGEMIFSHYYPNSRIQVVENDYWYSDKWDPMNYGQEYDFNQPFFNQFDNLMRKVPFYGSSSINQVNSEYCIDSYNFKNCYLVSGGNYNENCAYGIRFDHSNNCYDCAYLNKCELCYQGFMLNNCHKAFYSANCDGCQEIYFCKNCTGCSNCFGCINLRNKKNYIFNKPYSKEEYLDKLKELNLGSINGLTSLKMKVCNHFLKYPVKFMYGRKNNNVIGNYINNSKNVYDSYEVNDSEDSRHCQLIFTTPGVKDCYDYTIWGSNVQRSYETYGVGEGANGLKFSHYCFFNCFDSEYCMHCHSCKDCFASIGLRHKQYCILNKQYTKEEYEQLVPKIKKHMDDMPYISKSGAVYKYGEFFPPEFSPFAYNDGLAQEYFPIIKEEALKRGYNWYDKPDNEYKPTIKGTDLPDDIKDVGNSVLKEVIGCASDKCVGSGAFRIILQELEFYQKQGIPLPQLCPACRHQNRIKQRNPMKLWKRQCMNKGCNTTFQTIYSPDRKEIVYCEKCYNEEVS